MMTTTSAPVIHSGGITWIQYATFVLVLLGILVTFAGWLGRKFLALDVSWTDETAEPEVEHRGPKTILVGAPTETLVRVRPRIPVQLARLDVRLQRDASHWEWQRPRFLNLPQRIYESVSPATIRVAALRDVNKAKFVEGSGTGMYPRELITSFHRRDKSLLHAEFSPIWRVGAGDAVILGITVHADEAWSGLLTLTLPNAIGRRVWKRLPLVAQ